MIIRFEGVKPSSEWAMDEGKRQEDGDTVVIAEPVGTPGQQFRMKLLGKLFQFLGRVHTPCLRFVVVCGTQTVICNGPIISSRSDHIIHPVNSAHLGGQILGGSFGEILCRGSSSTRCLPSATALF